MGSDPILRLVWLVLVIYWLAILLPVPVLMNVRKSGSGVRSSSPIAISTICAGISICLF